MSAKNPGRQQGRARRGIDWRAGEPAYRVLATVIHTVNTALCNHDWRGRENAPRTGGVLVVANHISNYDPLALGEYLIWSGRWPRFLGKSDLWAEPVVGYFAKACRQIPVLRNTAHAIDALAVARTALENGELVVIYPEGTITADPDGWPMTARTGAAKLALETRCQVLPVGQWGANQVIRGKKVHFPEYFPRKTLQVEAGRMLDLSDLYDRTDDPRTAHVAADRMRDAVTELVAGLRGVPAPADEVYDIRVGKRVPWNPVEG